MEAHQKERRRVNDGPMISGGYGGCQARDALVALCFIKASSKGGGKTFAALHNNIHAGTVIQAPDKTATAALFRGRHLRMHLSDDHLVQAYLERGDQRAFRLLVERHQERIYGYLLGMVRDRSLADDLFQETFLRVLNAMQQRRGAYQRQGRWLAWVMRIARNAALDHLRSRKKWQDVDANFDEDGASYWDRLPDDGPAVDDAVARMEEHDWLEAHIEGLPPEQREVLLLRHETDLTFREIAELTGVSINTALGRMRYALLNLRREMSASKKKQLVDG